MISHDHSLLSWVHLDQSPDKHRQAISELANAAEAQRAYYAQLGTTAIDNERKLEMIGKVKNSATHKFMPANRLTYRPCPQFLSVYFVSFSQQPFLNLNLSLHPHVLQFEKEVTRCIKVMEELESVIARKKGVSQQVILADSLHCFRIDPVGRSQRVDGLRQS